MGLFLLLIARVLSAMFIPVGVAYSFTKLIITVRCKTVFKRMDSYFKVIAISVDQTGNVIMQDIFNDLLITKDGHKFGNEDETISSVVGKNLVKGTLTKYGKVLNLILENLDENHSINSIEKD